jgi:hypothetical protein
MSEDGQVVDHKPPFARSCDEPSQSGLVPDRRPSDQNEPQQRSPGIISGLPTILDPAGRKGAG